MCSGRDTSGVLVVLLRDIETVINNDAVSSWDYMSSIAQEKCWLRSTGEIIILSLEFKCMNDFKKNTENTDISHVPSYVLHNATASFPRIIATNLLSI